MMNDNYKMVAAVAMTLIISGCSGGSGSPDTTDLQMFPDDQIGEDTANGGTSSEVSVSTEASTGLAVPTTPLSSSQMDTFVRNPLIAAIPAELNSSSTTGLSRRYITNPLIN